MSWGRLLTFFFPFSPVPRLRSARRWAGRTRCSPTQGRRRWGRAQPEVREQPGSCFVGLCLTSFRFAVQKLSRDVQRSARMELARKKKEEKKQAKRDKKKDKKQAKHAQDASTAEKEVALSAVGAPVASFSAQRSQVGPAQPEPLGARGLWVALAMSGAPPFVIAFLVLGGLFLATGIVLLVVAFSSEVKRRRKLQSNSESVQVAKPADAPPRSLVAGLLALAVGVVFFGLGTGLACRVPYVILT
jgi:cobalamin biosynthesis Mg chelatase CobN